MIFGTLDFAENKIEVDELNQTRLKPQCYRDEQRSKDRGYSKTNINLDLYSQAVAFVSKLLIYNILVRAKAQLLFVLTHGLKTVATQSKTCNGFKYSKTPVLRC